MVIWPAFRMRQYRVNDHPYHAPQFSSPNRRPHLKKFESPPSESVPEKDGGGSSAVWVRLLETVRIRPASGSVRLRLRMAILVPQPLFLTLVKTYFDLYKSL